MPHSIINYNGDGVTDTWSISFTLGYMKKDDVTAWVVGELDGADNPLLRTIEWITDTTVRISGAIPQTGETLRFTRTTDVTIAQHDFSDGSSMNEIHFDENQMQVLMLAQEIRDGRLDALGQALNFGNQRAINMADPIDPTDGVNKRFLEQVLAAALVGGDLSLFAFTALGDTPQNYIGHSDKLLTVATTENGVSFRTASELGLGGAAGSRGYVSVVQEAGATPTVQDAWLHRLVRLETSGIYNLTVDDGLLTSWAVGNSCDFVLIGAGEATFVPAVGTSIFYPNTDETTLRIRNGYVSLIKVGTQEYSIVGHTEVQ